MTKLEANIIGQRNAIKAIAIATRNRARRRMLSEEDAKAMMPKNMLMVGPTGVGKTEISRSLAKITNSPYVKVEATKYTEVGFYGKDVDTMCLDLVLTSIQTTKKQRKIRARTEAMEGVENRLVEILVGMESEEGQDGRTFETFKKYLQEGLMEENEIEVFRHKKVGDL